MKMENKNKVYVKTVYEPSHYREPDITGYVSEKEANKFISICLKWGIGIVSCQICPKPE